MDTFRYDLRLQGRNIRLLQLQPGEDGKQICFTLNEYPLDAGVSFEALSYTWGDASDRVDTICNRASLSVTRSLHSALLTFRRLQNTTLMWVDAVSINQTDLQERSEQVRLMTATYSQAHVLVWLGEERDEDTLAFSLLQQLSDIPKD
jgi:hypothetical protein